MRTVRLNITLPEDLKKRLQEISKNEHRPLSNLISKILLDWLKEKDKKPSTNS